MRPSSLLRSAAAAGDAHSYAKSLSYATTLVRKFDSDAIYPSHFYPAASRPAYLALKAFNVELATIDDNVSNPMVGRMRYQWWRDAVKGVFESRPPPHPLCTLLSTLPQRPQLSSYHFTRLINAREQHFLNPSFHNLQDLADYSAGTQASLLYLLLQATSPPRVGGAGELLAHAKPFEHKGDEHPRMESRQLHLAVASTIAILLRSIPHHATKRINVIPAVIAARHNLREESLFRQGPNAEGLRECVATMVGIAEAELRTARGCFDGTTGVPERAVPVFASATSARSFLTRLSSDKVAFDVFNGDLQKRYWKYPFQVWGDVRYKRF
ncbi:Squalene/phytoene synthase [Leucosporidium creatinivorum]|uniref:Squalene/phytoene synthase n=1 Tax=Leucosporidium creatinivorum TaxID=106004 RepID=A0A1Y2FS30_9BASI|nr:Squalene/phytoene synthase [Leucosporidium creatinivorum]